MLIQFIATLLMIHAHAETILNCAVLEKTDSNNRIKVNCDQLGIGYASGKQAITQANFIFIKPKTLKTYEQREFTLKQPLYMVSGYNNARKFQRVMDELNKAGANLNLSNEAKTEIKLKSFSVKKEVFTLYAKTETPSALECKYRNTPDRVVVQGLSKLLCVANMICKGVDSIAICLAKDSICPSANECAQDEMVQFLNSDSK